jgi:transcriptional regulator with XRE-family HTH domain
MAIDADMDEKDAVAARLVAARDARGLSQTQLADMLDIQRQRLSLWENGGAFPNSARMIRTLCDALGISADWLIFGRTGGLPPETYRAIYAKGTRR